MGFYFYLNQAQKDFIQSEFKASINSFVADMKQSLIQRIVALDRMADRTIDDSEFVYQAWLPDAKNYYHDFGGFEAIGWADKTSTIQWIFPVEEKKYVLGLVLNQEGRRNEALEWSIKNQQGGFSKKLLLKGLGEGFLSVHPTYKNDNHFGFIVAAYSAENFFTPYIDNRYNLEFFIDGESIYGKERKDSEFTLINEFSVGNVKFKILSQPTENFLTPLKQSFFQKKIIFWGVGIIGILIIYFFIYNQQKVSQLNHKQKEASEAMGKSVIVSETDTAGMITFVNQKFIEISGYSKEELLGQNHRLIKSDEHDKAFFEQMWQTVNAGETWTGQIKNLAKDGSYYWVDSTISPIVNTEGKIDGFRAIRYDITAQKNHEVEIANKNRETQILNDLLEIDPSTQRPLSEILAEGLEIVFKIPWLKVLNKGGVFLVDQDKLILTTSKGLGDKVESMCQEVEKGRCLCGRAFEQSSTVHAACVDHRHENTFEGIAPHGHYNVPIKDKADQVIGVIVYYLPHAHKRSQKEVAFLESCAEVFANIIMSYQYEDQLIASRNEAIQAERAKTSFLANMSHEIRSPMNGVLGMVQLLNDTNLNAEQHEMLETIQSSGESLLTIINDILDVTKIESGKLELEHVRFNLKRCIDDAMFLSSYATSQKGIDIVLMAKEEAEYWFQGDITRIRQIVVNLISNAVKFTQQGQITITLRKEKLDETKSNVMIEVKDTGVGIAPEAQDRMFQAFSQADNSITRKFGGTGLGLNICRQLVSIMKGRISFKSKLGEGTTFYVELPLEQAESEVEQVHKSRTFENIGKEFSHQILLVEDNSVNQKIGKMMLKKLGYSCDIAANGIEALQALERKQYSIIFMDMQMPEMDGLSATREIIKKYGDTAPPIIAMTANAFAEDKQNCFEAGMVDFIAKPVKAADLKQALLEYHLNYKKTA